ncbi:MAG: hypothetical protein Cons2KO_04580 [Congregibacter sp.]
MLNALSHELTAAGIRVVGVNFDDDPRAKTLEIAAKLGIEFPTLTSDEQAELALRAPDVMPTTYLISPEREIKATFIGLQSREQIVGKLSQMGLLPRVTQLASPASQNSSLSRLTRDENDKLYLSWVTEHDGGAQLAHAGLAGEAWTEPEVIAEGRDWFLNWADFPMLSVHAGDKVAHWLRRSASGTYDYDIMAKFYDARSRAWGEAIKINDDGVDAEHGFVSMTSVGERRSLLTWLDGRNTKAVPQAGPMTLRAALFDALGERLQEWELDSRVCDCCQTSSALSSRGPVVVYRDRSEDEIRDTSIVRLEHGEWSAPQTIHSDNWRVLGCPVNGPSVSALGEQLAVAWFTANEEIPRVKLALSDDGGRRFAAPTEVASVNTNGRIDTAILDGGEVVVSWLATEGKQAHIMLSRFTAQGTQLDVTTVADTSASRQSGFPVIESVGESVYVTWTDVSSTSQVRVARVDYP